MFRVVSTDFWTDPFVVDVFTPEDKYFMLYLLTNPHTRQSGIYQLNIKVASFETGYSKDTISSLIERFQNKYNRIVYNYDTQEVGIFNYIKHSVIRGGTPVTDCIRSDLSTVKDKEIIRLVYLHMAKFFESTEKEAFKSIGAVFKEYTETNNENEYDNDNDNDNEESYHDSCHDSRPETETPETPTNKALLFEEFWKAYPKKQAKAQARKYFDKIKRIQIVIEHIMYSLNRYKSTHDWIKDNGQFVPMASTWLNQKRWLDFDMVEEQDEYTPPNISPEPEREPFNPENERLYREALKGNKQYDYTAGKT